MLTGSSYVADPLACYISATSAASGLVFSQVRRLQRLQVDHVKVASS